MGSFVFVCPSGSESVSLPAVACVRSLLVPVEPRFDSVDNFLQVDKMGSESRRRLAIPDFATLSDLSRWRTTLCRAVVTSLVSSGGKSDGRIPSCAAFSTGTPADLFCRERRVSLPGIVTSNWWELVVRNGCGEHERGECYGMGVVSTRGEKVEYAFGKRNGNGCEQ